MSEGCKVTIVSSGTRQVMKLDEAWAYCKKMLPLVSRTFALNIGHLNGVLHRAVLIGYLLFRIADTIEDSIDLTADEKIATLNLFVRVFETGIFPALHRGSLNKVLSGSDVKNSPEGDLLVNSPKVFLCYRALPETYRIIMGQALVEAAQGMAMYQKRKRDDPRLVFQLKDEEDLEQYCYYVAGVVGKMLTRFFCLESSLVPLTATLEKYQIPFGLCLQLTNIAKDYPKDLKRGWCYIPETMTRRFGIKAEDLLETPYLKRQEIIETLINETLPHLESAFQYILALPPREISIRMFCLIPFTLAYYTLLHLKTTGESKINRAQVEKILNMCRNFCLSNHAFKKDYNKVRTRLCPDFKIEKKRER